MSTPTCIDSCYRVIRPLGEGLTGEVYLVEGPEGKVALKLLKPFADPELEQKLVSAFKFEFGFLKDLRHPHVVRIEDFGFDTAQRRFYFTEEYLDALPIDQYAKQATPESIGHLFVQAIEGLQAIHRAKILHGDLKPGNLLVVTGPAGAQVKMIDLGLSDPRFLITAGTPSTMAPEKILGDPVDERSDLYSLGVVFYSLLAGENPFARETLDQTYQAHLSFRPDKLTLKNPRVSPHWNEIFENLLAKNPAYRYRTCADLLQALDLSAMEVGREEKRPKAWSLERWIGRESILKEIDRRLATASRGKSPQLLWVVGEAGVGKSRLAQEIKYRFQMEKRRVFQSRPDPARLFPPPREKVNLWIVDEWNRMSAWQDMFWPRIKSGENFESLMFLLSEAEAAALRPQVRDMGIKAQEVRIPPLSRAELEDFLLQVSGLSEVPAPFFQALWENTRGNPGLAVALLSHLAKQNKLVDVHGQWNLAIFKEAGLDFTNFDLDLPEIDRALASVAATDAATRVVLYLQRSEEWLKRNRLDEVSRALQTAEEESAKIENLSSRLQFRSRIYEKKAYLCIRGGRFQEARNLFERSLALLEESGVADPVLSIRLNNFVAWLNCQEGKIDDAIQIFSEQRLLWQRLKSEDRERVLNNDLGFAYLQKGDASQAMKILNEDLDFFTRIGVAGSQMKARYNLAEAHLLVKDYEAAIQQYLQAAELARLERNIEFLLRTYNGLGKTRHLQGKWREALRHYERALEFARYLEDFLSAAAIAQNIGSIHLERGDLEAAEPQLQKALKMLKKLPESGVQAKYLQCRALLELGEVFRRRNLFEEAAGCLGEAHAIASQEKGVEALRFWVMQARCRLEKDRGRSDRLRDLLAELLPLADDAEKREALAEFSQNLPGRSQTEATQEAQSTRVEVALVAPGSVGGIQALVGIARALASESDPQKLLPLILRQAVELSGAEAGLLLLEDERSELHPVASVNLNLDAPLAAMSESIAKQVLAQGEAVVSANAQVDGRFNAYQSVVALHLRSLLALPVAAEQRMLGVLALVHRYREGIFSPDSLELLRAFADLAGIALQQAKSVTELRATQEQLAADLEVVEASLAASRRELADSSIMLRFSEHRLLSCNPAMRDLFQVIERIRDTDLSALLQGESGTGKELVARCLHRDSRRRRGPFVAVNCAALPAALIESELFGYRAGAFTGAQRDKKGLIEEANGGTLFLDEIAELELGLQSKLLRVLQERALTPLGDTRPRDVRFRLVCATHRDLQKEMEAGRFRQDLYYRIAEISLHLPPLRERMEDIPLLAQFFLDEYLEENGESTQLRLGKDLLKALMNYAWPGNVRELQNVIRVATALRRGAILHLAELPQSMQDKLGLGLSRPKSATESKPSKDKRVEVLDPRSLFDPSLSWREMETLLIAKALAHFGFNAVQAAKALRCAPSKIYQRIREYRLSAAAPPAVDHPYVYSPGSSLEAIKREVFARALAHCHGSPYQTARMLRVSPGMVYQRLQR